LQLLAYVLGQTEVGDLDYGTNVLEYSVVNGAEELTTLVRRTAQWTCHVWADLGIRNSVLFRYQDVLNLNVSVDNIILMQVIHSFANLPKEPLSVDFVQEAFWRLDDQVEQVAALPHTRRDSGSRAPPGGG
jgi:hypothetical protein